LVGASPDPGTVRRLKPDGYLESQGAFTERMRREAATRFGLRCRIEFGTLPEFPEYASTAISSIRRLWVE
jgi:hypothetical protein